MLTVLIQLRFLCWISVPLREYVLTYVCISTISTFEVSQNVSLPSPLPSLYSASRQLPTSEAVSGHKSGTHAQRSRIDYPLLQTAFTEQSNHPDNRLRSLLDRVIEAPFIRDHQLEPTQDSIEGWLIMDDDLIDHGSSSTHSPAPCGSIYRLFISGSEHMCLFCGSKRGGLSRALGCVRRHLDHRPFRCQGKLGGCNTCHDKYVSVVKKTIY